MFIHIFLVHIGKRMYSFLLDNVLVPSTTSSSATVAMPAALSDIEHELLDVTKKLGPIAAHNFTVFRPFYEKILTNFSS
jgi:hypothetical protein